MSNHQYMRIMLSYIPWLLNCHINWWFSMFLYVSGLIWIGSLMLEVLEIRGVPGYHESPKLEAPMRQLIWVPHLTHNMWVQDGKRPRWRGEGSAPLKNPWVLNLFIGKITICHGKSPFFMGNNHFSWEKWRVQIPINWRKLEVNR